MGKLKYFKSRKISPSLPVRNFIGFGLLDDNCYECKNRNSCNHCYKAKQYNKEKRRKDIKKMRKRIV